MIERFYTGKQHSLNMLRVLFQIGQGPLRAEAASSKGNLFITMGLPNRFHIVNKMLNIITFQIELQILADADRFL